MEPYLADVFARAATIDELCSQAFIPAHAQKRDAEPAAMRLAAWCRECAHGDWDLFARRLESSGLTFPFVLSRLASVEVTQDVALLRWLSDIDHLLRLLEQHEPRVSSQWASDARPFENLLGSIVTESLGALKALAFGRLSDRGRGVLEQNCHANLLSIIGPALYARLVNWRRQTANDAGSPENASANATSEYKAFERHMRASGFRQLFGEFPVLARLLAVRYRQWLQHTREWISRLHTDFSDIRRLVPALSDDDTIAGMEADLSDRHRDGRTVTIIRFTSNHKLVYKPKNLAAKAALHSLVQRLNEPPSPFSLRTARVLSKDGYGWAEFVTHAGCADATDVSLFYERVGGWLALLHVLCGADFHVENMIASASHPVPIDVEMLFQTPEKSEDVPPAMSAIFSTRQQISNSVTSVGLLPCFTRLADNRVVDLGGFAHLSHVASELHWEHIGTIDMTVEKRSRIDDSACNLPFVEATHIAAGLETGPFQSGFSRYAHYLSGIRIALAESPCFRAFESVKVRSLLRPTRFTRI